MTGTVVAFLVWVVALVFIWRKMTSGQCPECEGYGIVDFGSDPARTCDRCKGSGTWKPIPELQVRADRPRPVCATCLGTGQVVDGKDGYKPMLCPECWRGDL